MINAPKVQSDGPQADIFRSVEDFFIHQALPFWWEHGRCARTGSWFEGMGFDGQPLAKTVRRGRVWPRQIFAFGMAYRLGLFTDDKELEKLTENTRYLLRTSRLDDGQFAGALDATGQPTGEPALLYDLAFYALAGAELARQGIKEGFELAETAFAEIDMRFRDSQSGGYHADHRKADAPKLANPHMHLLEASIAWYEATSDAGAADRMTEILSLFRTHFLRDDGHVREALTADYGPLERGWIEPGHGFEWAYLYRQAEQCLGNDGTSVSRLIVEASEGTLLNGLAPNRVGEQPSQFRLWPQLERLRIIHTAFPSQDISPILKQLDRLYFSHGPAWGWNDEVDQNRQAISQYVPASMVYHLVTALGPLFAKR